MTRHKTGWPTRIACALALAAGVTMAVPAGAAETALGKLAASMKPGTWAELKTGGYTADLLKTQTHHILEYTDKAVWDPTSRQVFFVGQGHYSALKFIKYSAADNRWQLLPTPPWWGGDPKTGKGSIGHAYDNNAIDPVKGIFYFHQSYSAKVHKYDIAASKWSTLPEMSEAPLAHGTALCYFPEMKGLVRVLGGTVYFFSEAKNSWSLLKDKVPMGPYHNIARYSPADKAVIFGGGNDSKLLYQLDAKGRIAALPEAPFVIRVSSTVVTVDPVSGAVLVLNMEDKHKFWALDTKKKEWKKLADAPLTHGAATPITGLGVNLYFTETLKVYLYKHK